MSRIREIALLHLVAMGILAVGFGAGCTPVRSGAAVTQQVTKEELREKLERFEDSFEANVRSATEQLVQSDGSRRVKRLTLVWQMRLLPLLRNALDQENPLGSFLDVWTLCVRMRQHLTEGDGRNLFGPHQSIAVHAARECEAEIEQIGRQILSSQMYDRARERVHAVAKEHPLRGEFSGTEVRATHQVTEEDVVLQGVLEIPLAPFRWLGGVDATAQSIKEFTAVAARLTDVVQGLAADARLQIQLLLLETEDMEMIQRTIQSLEKVSDSSERLTAVSEKLPAEIRRELSTFFEELDQRQPELRETLSETRRLAEQLDPTGRSVAGAGEAWTGTARAIQEMVASFRTPGVSGEAGVTSQGTSADGKDRRAGRVDAQAESTDAAKPAPYDINDYRLTAEALTQTARELQKLAADINDLSASNALSTRIEELTTQVQGLMAESTLTAKAMTDHAAWRGLQLLLAAFVFALLYRLLTQRWMRSTSQ